MSAATILLATRSEGKLRELRPLFAHAALHVVSLDDIGLTETADEDALECHESFEDNALAKARHFSRAAGGMPTVADDSGLAVRALDGAPGVRSKRWSGSRATGAVLDAANNALLQQRLAGAHDRSAMFVCAAAFVDGKRELVCRGETLGEILTAPSGQGGFGYDAYFLSTDLGVSFGLASIDEKERVSHRGRAFSALLAALPSALRADSADSAVTGNELRRPGG